MTEENGPRSEARGQELGRRSPWSTIGKLLLYVCAGGVLLVLLVFGTCVLLFRI